MAVNLKNDMDPLQLEEEGSSSRQPCKKQRLTTTTTTTSSFTPELPPPPVVLSPEPVEEEKPEGSDEVEESDLKVEAEKKEQQSENQLKGMDADLINQQAVATETLPPPLVLSPELGGEEEEDSEGSESSGEEESDGEAESEEEDRRPTSLTFTDPDLLDCPICFDVLKIPVYQCENGHIACASCFLNINNKCPTCAGPIGHNRCRAIEKVLEAVRIPCENIMYGCHHMMKYYGDDPHKSWCQYSPCICPMDGCYIIDSSSKLCRHIHANHSTTSFRYDCRFTVILDTSKTLLFLREETSGAVFVLNGYLVDNVRVLGGVVVIRPKSPMRSYRYELEANHKETMTSLTLQAPVENVPNLDADYEPPRYLVVNFSNRPPTALELDIRIWVHGF